MRHRTDGNQAAIIRALREGGVSVCSLVGVGGEYPNLLVGWNGTNFLIEVKNPDGRGRVYVVCDELQALALLDGW